MHHLTRTWHCFFYLFHFKAYSFQTVGESFLKDIQLRFSEVQRGSASSIQGINSGPCKMPKQGQ